MRNSILFLSVLGVVLAGCTKKDTITCDPGFMLQGEMCVPTVDSGTDTADVDPADGVDASDGDGAVSACDPVCSGDMPLCDEYGVQGAAGECVACLDDDGCEGDETCSAGACVECTTSAECTTATAPVCDDTGTCVPCTIGENTGCDGVMDGARALGVCADVEGINECVECDASEESACGDFVCDVLARTCTSDIEPGDAGNCDVCVSDSHCADEMVCIQETFGGEPTEFRCAWPKAATGTGRPNGACLSIAPYVDSNDDEPRLTIAGEEVVTCMLATTTCQALEDYRDKDCGMTLGDAADAMCGLPGVADGLCRNREAMLNRCTYACRSSEDCRGGAACNLDDSVCEF